MENLPLAESTDATVKLSEGSDAMNPTPQRCHSSASGYRYDYYVEVSATVVVEGGPVHECIGEMGPFPSSTDAIIAGCCVLGSRVRDMFREPHTIAYCTLPGRDHGHARVDRYSVNRSAEELDGDDEWSINGALHSVGLPNVAATEPGAGIQRAA